MNTNLSKITVAEYYSEIFKAGIDGYIRMFRDMAEFKTSCTDRLLWIGSEPSSHELLDAMDHFISVAENVASEIATDEQANDQ